VNGLNRTVARRFIPPAIVLGLFFMTPERAEACSCGSTGDVREALERAAVVFTGRVVSQEESAYRKQGGQVQTARRVRLQVVDSWKGNPGPEITVFSQVGEVECGYPFDASDVHLVFADQRPMGDEEALWVDLCGRSKPLSPERHAMERRELSEDLVALEQLAGAPRTRKPKTCATCSIGGAPGEAIFALLLFGLAIVPLRRR